LNELGTIVTLMPPIQKYQLFLCQVGDMIVTIWSYKFLATLHLDC